MDPVDTLDGGSFMLNHHNPHGQHHRLKNFVLKVFG